MSGAYIPPGNCDTKSRNKAFLMKLVKGSETKESCLKKIKANISGLSEKVESRATMINKLEQQFGQISATLNHR